MATFIPGLRFPAFCLAGFVVASPAFAQKAYLPFKVYTGKVASFDITKGVNTIRVNDGFVVTGTIPVSPSNTYRIKPGQALALLYAGAVNRAESRVNFGSLPTENFGKVIRKVEGKEVEMQNYVGVSMRWELTYVFTDKTDAYQISRMYKSKFSPALPAADFERTDGIYLMHSEDPEPARKVPAFAKDVNKVAGKVLTAHYLVSRIDADAYFTVETDFSDVALAAMPGSAAAAGPAAAPAAQAGVSPDRAREDRAQAMQKAQDVRFEAKKQEEQERSAAKEDRAVERAEAAAERAKKRAETALARRLKPQ